MVTHNYHAMEKSFKNKIFLKKYKFFYPYFVNFVFNFINDMEKKFIKKYTYTVLY